MSVELPDRAPQLLFLHIRKTAGSTVRTLLSNRFAASTVLLDWHEVRQRDEDPNRYALVMGHVTTADLQRFHTPPRVLVFLRRPLERVLSAYCFYRDHTPEQMAHFRRKWPAELTAAREAFHQAAAALPLTDLLQREPELARMWLADVQTRALAGHPDGQVPPALTPALLATACERLSRCEFVGLTERLAESLAHVSMAWGWEPPRCVPRVNESARRLSIDAIDPAAREILEDWNRLDQQLYQYAEMLWVQQDERFRRGAWAIRDGEIPSGACFTFDQPIHGSGWHARERCGDRWICWTGPDRESTLMLRVDGPSPWVLECRVDHAITPETLAGMTVRVQDQPLAVHWESRGGATWLRAEVPFDAISSAGPATTGAVTMRLQFSVLQTLRPRDMVPSRPDDRRLGVAFSEVRLRPAGLSHASC